MTTKHLTGTYPSGYTLASTYNELIIEKTASVGGQGVAVYQLATVINQGAIQSNWTYGLIMKSGGVVQNLGTITALDEGVNLAGGGDLINGSAADRTATISARYQGVIDGNYGGAITLTNFGVIESQSSGVYLTHLGGSIVNGSASDRQAVIMGGNYGGVRIDPPWANATDNAPTTVTNFGTIAGSSGISVQFGLKSDDRLIAEAGSTWIGAVLGGGGTLELASGAGTITGLGVSGTVSGAEAMTFSHFDAYILDSGTTWALSGSNLTHPAQSFTLETGATISLAAGVKFDLAGPSTLDGDVTGEGGITIGAAVLDGLSLGGSMNASISGMIDQTGTVTIGDRSANAVTVSILSNGEWEIGGQTIARGAAAKDLILDAGRLINDNGAGIVEVGLTVSGVVEAAGGDLDLTHGISGAGTLQIDAGATLEVDSNASRSLKAAFNGGTGTLALADPKTFAATIGGLAAGDTIDLLRITATGASVNGKDQLVVVDGTTSVATLQLTGDYTGASFNVGSDGHGGAAITLATPARDMPIAHAAAARQAFVSAMAQAQTGGPAVARCDHADVRPSILLARPG